MSGNDGFDSADDGAYNTAESDSRGSGSAGSRSLTPPAKRTIDGDEKDLSAAPAGPSTPFVMSNVSSVGAEFRTVSAGGPFGALAGEHRQPLLAEHAGQQPHVATPLAFSAPGQHVPRTEPAVAHGPWAGNSAALRPDFLARATGGRPEFLPAARSQGSHQSVASASQHYSDAESRGTACFGNDQSQGQGQGSVPEQSLPRTYPSLPSDGPGTFPPDAYASGRAVDSLRSLLSNSGSRQSRGGSDALGAGTSSTSRSSGLPTPSAPLVPPTPTQSAGPQGAVQHFTMSTNNPPTSATLIEGRDVGQNSAQGVHDPVHTIHGVSARIPPQNAPTLVNQQFFDFPKFPTVKVAKN